MGKGVAIVVALVVAGVLLTLLVSFMGRLIQRSGWAHATRTAKWESHTERGNGEGSGSPLLLVTVRLVARKGSQARIISTETVGAVPVTGLYDPELLELQARADGLAATYNSLV